MDQLHPSVEALIRRVINDGKTFDWMVEFASVAELDRLAREQDGPPSRDLVALLDTPLIVGNLKLSRLSWAAIEWYNDTALAWWRDNPALRELALAWAHAYSRDPEAIKAVSTLEGKARRRIKMWSWGLTAPWEAIQAAVDVLLPKPTKSKSGGSGSPRAQHSVLAHLVSRTGLPSSFWLYESSYEHVVDVLREIAEASFSEQAQLAALMGVRLSDPEDSWAFQSFLRYRNASKAFLDRHGVEHRRKKTQPNHPKETKQKGKK